MHLYVCTCVRARKRVSEREGEREREGQRERERDRERGTEREKGREKKRERERPQTISALKLLHCNLWACVDELICGCCLEVLMSQFTLLIK